MKTASLTVANFRAFRQLDIEGLGRVNLITGRNNSGKSSVLEALRILASDASPSVLFDILSFREEDAGDAEERVRPVDAEGAFLLSNLFYGFPQFSPRLEPILIRSKGSERSLEVALEIRLASEMQTTEGFSKLVFPIEEANEESESFPVLVVTAGTVRRVVRLDSFRRPRFRRPFSESADEAHLPCVYVSPYGGERTATLGSMWDKIALSDREKDVVEALQIIDADITAVSMVGGEGSRGARTAIVKSNNLPRPVPLRSFGDGLNRLFGIVLSLVNAKGGLLLIDEFENGMHHTIQTDVWKAIFRLASRLDVQVVATSHSWDAIEAFQEAARETPEEGVLIRLSRAGEEIVPTVFKEDELAVAAREGIEVR